VTTTPNSVLGDRYTLTERIAVGGMGEVWRAHDDLLGRDVAVKVLKQEYADDPSFRARFKNEARHTAALSHPGIANVFDYGEWDGRAYLVMELVAGEPLSARLAREGALSVQQTLDIVGQAGLALQAAHDAGVVHRDVKPGNLLIRPDGVVKVTDFGIARAADAAPITQTGLMVGTAAYLAPEQAAGHPATAASDVYALGVVAYECLSGRRPFAGDTPVGVALAHLNTTPPELPSSVPPLVRDFVLRALEKDPDRRPPSAGDFGRTALALLAQFGPDAALAATPAPAPPPTRPLTQPIPHSISGPNAAALPPFTDAQRRRTRNIFVAVGALVVVVGFLLLHSCAGGATQVRMPNVVGRSYHQAAALLVRDGLGVRRDTVRSQRRRNTVLRQSIPPGTTVGSGSTVVLTVSAGPPRVTVNRADYVGRPVADVVRALAAEHLAVRLVGAPGGGPPGTVTDVSPTGSVEEGSTVTVTVAAGGPGPKQPGPKPPKHGPHGEDG
jgi:serine/threonine-protein kinase